MKKIAIYLAGIVLAAVLSGCIMDTTAVDYPVVSAYYVLDTENDRLVRMYDTEGSGWSTYGSFGTERGNFDNPQGMTIAANGIYIADTGNHRIVRTVDMAGYEWMEFGEEGAGVNQFNSPESLYLAPDGYMYIADTGNNRIVRISSMYGDDWLEDKTPNTLSSPGDVFVDSDGKIYIADTGNNRIVMLESMTDTNPDVLTTFNTTDTFSGPKGVCVDGGSLYVADTGNNRVVRFDDISGTNPVGVVRTLTGFNPVGLYFGDEYVFSAAPDQDKIVFYNFSGTTKTFGGSGGGTNQFSSPSRVIPWQR